MLIDDTRVCDRRIPLEKTVLNVKLLLSRFGSVTQLLAQSVSPPPPERVVTAMNVLYDAGALTRNDEEGEVTELGRVGVHMPVDLPLVKLILLGRAFGCVNDSIVMAAALSLQDVFLMPSRVFVRNLNQFVTELSGNFASRYYFDADQFSEPLCFLNMYKAWLASSKSPGWCRKYGVSHARAKQLDMFVTDLTSKVLPLYDATQRDLSAVTKLNGKFNPARLANLGFRPLDTRNAAHFEINFRNANPAS